MSIRSPSHRFVAKTGFNFKAWQQRARIQRLLEMLAAGLPVTAIALDLGYAMTGALIAVFRRTFGVMPAAYREHL